jgi:lysophospholipase L1-like esterase
VMGVFTYYSNQSAEIQILGYTLKKSKELDLLAKVDSVIIPKKIITDSTPPKKKSSYGTKRHILLMGDSQVEGLKTKLYDYCVANGHELLGAVTWYSGTDIVYASSDTIEKIIKKYKPDYILFAIGLNQLYQREMSPSEKAVNRMLELFDTIPYCWIGPANFTTDKGINTLYQQMIPSNCFFLSKDLVLERADDRRHPSKNGYQVWMDTIGRWMEKQAKYPIEMHKPDSAIKKRKITDIVFPVRKKEEKTPETPETKTNE